MMGFQCPRVGVQVQPRFLPSSGTVVNPGTGRWKLTWLKSMSEIHWLCLFENKEVKIWDPTTRFRIWQHRNPAWKLHLHMHILAEGFFFGLRGGIGVFWKSESRRILWYQCRIFTRYPFYVFICTSIVYGWCNRWSNSQSAGLLDQGF